MSWIQTYSGKQFWPLDPHPDEVDIYDIAHALSNLCRFAGHTREFYSVAQHSVIVSFACDQKDAMSGLLHDAAEAYCIDMPRPIKHSPGMAAYREVEDRITAAIYRRFDLPAETPKSVKVADDAALMAERRDLMTAPPLPWSTEHAEPLEATISPLSPKKAEQLFILRFEYLAMEPLQAELKK